MLGSVQGLVWQLGTIRTWAGSDDDGSGVPARGRSNSLRLQHTLISENSHSRCSMPNTRGTDTSPTLQSLLITKEAVTVDLIRFTKGGRRSDQLLLAPTSASFCLSSASISFQETPSRSAAYIKIKICKVSNLRSTYALGRQVTKQASRLLSAQLGSLQLLLGCPILP